MKIRITEYVTETFEVEVDDLPDDASDEQIAVAAEELRVQYGGQRLIEVTDTDWERIEENRDAITAYYEDRNNSGQAALTARRP